MHDISEALREEVHRFGKHSYSEYLPAAKAEICKAAMCYARSGQLSGVETISPPPVENKNARCEQRAFLKIPIPNRMPPN